VAKLTAKTPWFTWYPADKFSLWHSVVEICELLL
jgi:hypothetical protein